MMEVMDADSPAIHPRIGRIAGSSPIGDVLVEWGAEPHAARLLAGLDRVALIRAENLGREVLLVFDGGDTRLPVVVGLVDRLPEKGVRKVVRLELDGGESWCPEEASFDGKRVVFDAEEEIVLRCGQGSITIRKDGKIVIRGTHLLSRSTGPVRIKGGSVNIN
jgi:hypothetical protein